MPRKSKTQKRRNLGKRNRKTVKKIGGADENFSEDVKNCLSIIKKDMDFYNAQIKSLENLTTINIDDKNKQILIAKTSRDTCALLLSKIKSNFSKEKINVNNSENIDNANNENINVSDDNNNNNTSFTTNTNVPLSSLPDNN